MPRSVRGAGAGRAFWLGFESGGEEVAGGQAAVGPPVLRDGENLFLGRAAVEPIGGLHGSAEGEVAREDDVFSLQGDEKGALDGPWADSGNGGQLGQDVVVRQAAQDAGIQ